VVCTGLLRKRETLSERTHSPAWLALSIHCVANGGSVLENGVRSHVLAAGENYPWGWLEHSGGSACNLRDEARGEERRVGVVWCGVVRTWTCESTHDCATEVTVASAAAAADAAIWLLQQEVKRLGTKNTALD